jgi:hypothetical protein
MKRLAGTLSGEALRRALATRLPQSRHHADTGGSSPSHRTALSRQPDLLHHAALELFALSSGVPVSRYEQIA